MSVSVSMHSGSGEKAERGDPGLGMGGLQCKRGGQGSPSLGGGNQVTRKR